MAVTTTQLSVTMINKPGALAQLFTALAKAHCDIAAMTMVDTSEHGTVRIVFSSDLSMARKVLSESNLGPVAETEVISKTLDNHPGAIADVCTKLAEAKVNIVYAYVTAAPGGKTVGIFKVSDVKKALKLLENGHGTKRRDNSGTVKRASRPSKR